jgi:hypothetical protein
MSGAPSSKQEEGGISPNDTTRNARMFCSMFEEEEDRGWEVIENMEEQMSSISFPSSEDDTAFTEFDVNVQAEQELLKTILAMDHNNKKEEIDEILRDKMNQASTEEDVNRVKAEQELLNKNFLIGDLKQANTPKVELKVLQEILIDHNKMRRLEDAMDHANEYSFYYLESESMRSGCYCSEVLVQNILHHFILGDGYILPKCASLTRNYYNDPKDEIQFRMMLSKQVAHLTGHVPRLEYDHHNTAYTIYYR